MDFRTVAGWRVAKDIGQAFLGRVVAGLTRLGMTVMLARVLRPSEYGLTAVLLNSGLLLSTVLEFGLGSAFIERESRTRDETEHRSHFLRLLFGRFWLWTAFLAIALVAWSLRLLPGAVALPVIVLGTGQNLSVSFLLLHQVRQDFAGYAWSSTVLAGTQFAWAALVAATFKLFSLPLSALLWGVAVLGWVPLPFLAKHARLSTALTFLGEARHHLGYLRSLLSFGKWVGMSSIAAHAFSRYGVLFLGAAGILEEAGRYDIAMTVGRSVNLLVYSTAAVLFPRFAQQPGAVKGRRFLTSVLRIGSVVLVASLSLYYLIGRWLIPIFYGGTYRTSVAYLDILMPGLLLPILVEPVVGIVIFSLGSPKTIFWIRLVKLVIFLLVGRWALENFRVSGLAATQTMLAIAENITIVALAFYMTRRNLEVGGLGQ